MSQEQLSHLPSSRSDSDTEEPDFISVAVIYKKSVDRSALKALERQTEGPLIGVGLTIMADIIINNVAG